MRCPTCSEAECPGCNGRYCDNCGPDIPPRILPDVLPRTITELDIVEVEEQIEEEESTVYVFSPYKPTREEFERLRKLYDERNQNLRFVTTPKRGEN